MAEGAGMSNIVQFRPRHFRTEAAHARRLKLEATTRELEREAAEQRRIDEALAAFDAVERTRMQETY